MPHDKYVLSWDVDKTKEYVKSKIGIPELKTRAMGALDDIQLDGKAIMNDDAKSLEAVLKEAGIEKKVHMVRLLAIIEEIREDTGYNVTFRKGWSLFQAMASERSFLRSLMGHFVFLVFQAHACNNDIRECVI